MHELFIILYRVAIIVLIAGLISPKYPLFFTPFKTRRKVVIIYLPLILLCFIASQFTRATTTPTKQEISQPTGAINIISLDSMMPEEEKQLIQFVQAYADRYQKEINTLNKTNIWHDRETKLNINPASNIRMDDWIGTVKEIGTTAEGNTYIAITINSHITLKTFKTAFDDAQDNTLITKDSPLFEMTQKLGVGSHVRFSGVLIKNINNNEKEAMITPEYAVRFSNIQTIG